MTLPKCMVPWTHVEVCTTGFVRPCAEFNRDILDEDGNKFDLNKPETDLRKVWNSQDLKDIRQRFLNGEKLSECSKCWQQEQQGLLSRRQRELDAHGKHLDICTDTTAPDPILLDVKLGIKCNLQCKICNSEYSNNWIKDEQEMFGQVINVQNGKDWTDDNINWQHIKDVAENLEVLYLSGGETLLLPNTIDLLQHLIDIDVAKNIWLKIHTNGTIRLSDTMLNIFKCFKAVRLMYSIDDIGSRFEYQRPPTKWSKVETNFIQAMQYDWIDLRITYTVSLLNSLSGTALTNWCKNVGFPLEHVEVNFLRHPIYYELGILSDQQKQFLMSHMGNSDIDQQVIKYMKTQYYNTVENTDWRINSRKDLDNLRKYVILSLDKKSKYKLEDVTPEIAKLIYNENTATNSY